jgi:hypothetical protein
MKGQSEPVVLIILLLLGIILFTTATLWGSGVANSNVDAGKVLRSEQFLKDLDSAIQSVAANGGNMEVEYPIDAFIYVKDNCTGMAALEADRCIQVEFDSSFSLPKQWIYLSKPDKIGSFSDSNSIIRENYDGKTVYMQLYYRIRRSDDINYTIQIVKNATYLYTPSVIEIVDLGTTNISNCFSGVDCVASKVGIIFK